MRLRPALLFSALLLLSACDSADEEIEVATATSTVTVAYEGRLDDGTVFDSSPRATFNLQRVIVGFREGIVGMREGETKTIVVPPEKGYGANPPDGIPPNATLTFEVELIEVLS